MADLNKLIPERNSSAISGSEFVKSIMNLVGQQREDLILNEVLSGNIPEFIKKFCSVTVSNGSNTITYLVMPDFLSIGNDSDYLRIPTFPGTAQKIADKLDCTLPTKKMVDDIWKAADNKLTPNAFGAPYDGDIIKSHRYEWINNKLNDQMLNKDKSKLTFGGKKNVILSNSLTQHSGNVCIYGWFYSNGSVIQGINAIDHNKFYVDYSHGITLIANDVMVNGNWMRMQDVFSNTEFAPLVSDEYDPNYKSNFTLKFTKY